MNKENVEIIAGTLNGFMERIIAEMPLSQDYQFTRRNSMSLHDQVVERTKALLEVLEELGNYYDCGSEVNSKLDVLGVCAATECEEMSTTSSQDMSLTLINQESYDPNETKYSSDMEITCIESSLSATPFVSIKSILKSGGPTLKKTNSTRKVRFEDEALNETWVSVVENKENLDVEICSKPYDACSSETQNIIFDTIPERPSSIKKQSKKSIRKLRGKTMDTWDILRRNDKPRKSWLSSPRTSDPNALRDIKTLVELKNDHSPNKKSKLCVLEPVNDKSQKSWSSNRRSREINALKDITTLVELQNDHRNNVGNPIVHWSDSKLNCAENPTRVSYNEALASSTPINGGLRLSLLPNDLDLEQFNFSWTPKLDILDSSVSF